MSTLAPGPRGLVRGEASGLTKLTRVRDRSVPACRYRIAVTLDGAQ